MQSLYELWRAAHPRSGLAGILDCNGEPYNQEDGDRSLLNFWAGVFTEVQGLDVNIREIILEGAPQLNLSPAAWILSYKSFVDMLKKRRVQHLGLMTSLFWMY